MGIIRSVAVAILAGVLLAGCAATVKRPSTQQAPLGIPASAASEIRLFVKSDQGHDSSEDWETFRAEWRTAVAGAAAKAGRRFVYLDTMPETFEGEGILVVVNINDYRYLTAGARYGFGVMTGNAYIDAKASFHLLPGQELVGTRDYSTSSTAWQGVFSAMTDKQLAAIAEEILAAVDSR